MLKLKNVGIKAILSCVPDKVYSIKNYKNQFGDKRIDKIINNTGISKKRIADFKINSSDLCLDASLKLFEKLKFDKLKIDGLVFVSQTRDYIMPQTSFILKNKLGLKDSVICFDLPLGCTGFIQGLYQSSMMINSGLNNVLLLCGDTINKYLKNDDISTLSVFGDGVSACIVEKNKSDMFFNIKTCPEKYDSIIMNKSFREDLIMKSKELHMDGLEVFNFVIKYIPKIIREDLLFLGKNVDDIDNLFFHQANGFIINYLNKSLKLEPSKSPIVLDGFGNTGSSSIPLAITETLFKKSKGKTILCGFGVGLSYGTCYVNLVDTKLFKTQIYNK